MNKNNEPRIGFIPNDELPVSPKYGSRYFGDGEDNFSRTEWEKKLWEMVQLKYWQKYVESRRVNYPALFFNPPDYATIVECENELESMGVKRTYR